MLDLSVVVTAATNVVNLLADVVIGKPMMLDLLNLVLAVAVPVLSLSDRENNGENELSTALDVNSIGDADVIVSSVLLVPDVLDSNFSELEVTTEG